MDPVAPTPGPMPCAAGNAADGTATTAAVHTSAPGPNAHGASALASGNGPPPAPTLVTSSPVPQDKGNEVQPPPAPPHRPPPPPPPPPAPPPPPPPTRLQSWAEVLALLRGYRETHLLVGFGDVAQYDDVGAAAAELEPLLAEVQRRTAGRWLLLYGGDPATPATPNVGVLVQLLARRWGCPVLAPIIDMRAHAAAEGSSGSSPPPPPPLQPGGSQAHLTYYYVLPAQYSGDVDREADAAAAAAATAPIHASNSNSSSILGKRRAEAEPEAEGASTVAAVGKEAAVDAAAAPAAAATATAAVTDGRGSILWGGLRHGQPVGGSAFYLHDDLVAGCGGDRLEDDGQSGGGGGDGGGAPPRRLLTSVIAAGGGDIAVQELQYLHERGVPWTYVPCAACRPPSHYTSHAGPVRDWAAAAAAASLPRPPQPQQQLQQPQQSQQQQLSKVTGPQVAGVANAATEGPAAKVHRQEQSIGEEREA